MFLGPAEIIRAIRNNEIRCIPYSEPKGISIDVGLGRHMYVKDGLDFKEYPPHVMTVLNDNGGYFLEYFHIEPGKLYLGHTEEFIGSSVPHIATILQTRSSYARLGLSVHNVAGIGHPGFNSRWTLELSLVGDKPLNIPVFSAIAQASFLLTTRSPGDEDFIYRDEKYNADLDNWTPESMLPKIPKELELCNDF